MAWRQAELQPDWGENPHSLAFMRMGFQDCEQHLILLKAYWEALEFELPSPLSSSAGWLGLSTLCSTARSMSTRLRARR
jgi:hypothetical protein